MIDVRRQTEGIKSMLIPSAQNVDPSEENSESDECRLNPARRDTARRKPMLVLRGRPTTEIQAWGDLF